MLTLTIVGVVITAIELIFLSTSWSV